MNHFESIIVSVFLTFFFKITTGKGIVCIHKYDQCIWTFPPPNTNFVIPQRSDTSIQTQYKSNSDASVDAHAVASYGLDQSTNHHGNTDVNNNDDSQSLKKPRKNNCSSSSFGDTPTTTNTPHSSTLTATGK